MNFTEKRLFLKSGLVFCLIQAILYIPVHMSYLSSFENWSLTGVVVFGAVASALSDLASFILPVIAATIIFISFAYKGAFHAIPKVLIFSLPYIISSVPEYYLMFLSAFDSPGALFFSGIYSLIIFAAVTAQMLALFGVICFFFRLPKDARFDKKTLSPLEDTDMFDFSNRFAKGLFGAVFVQFLISLIPEIISTVSYIIDNEGTYRIGEILTIVFTFLFVTLEMGLAYVIAYKLKSKLIYERLVNEDAAGNITERNK